MQAAQQSRGAAPKPGHEPGREPGSLPRHRATDLTEGGEMAQIELDGQVYTLRITRQGKLILTK